MLYQWYELGHAAVKPARAAADSYKTFFENPFNPMSHTTMGRSAVAVCEVFERTTRQYEKPEFGLPLTQVDGKTVAVTQEVVWQKPFCDLIHFKRNIKTDRAARDPRVLLVAPMSGHYATLLRGTVEALLPNHEVYITDWMDARDVPTSAGGFDLDDYIDYMAEIFRHFEGDIHVVAVCQPSVPVLAAVALMEAENDPHVPASMVLMGGPVDTRISTTAVNELAEQRGTKWFENNVIVRVPRANAGADRQVYPGFLQLSGFMSMNLDRHMKAQKDMFFHLVRGDGDSAERHREFYDEYLAVMDLTQEFFIQTIDRIFVNHQLPKREMMHRSRRIDLLDIKQVALMTVEGEKDDITGIGQCAAAQDLCANLPRAKKTHYECPGVGHYGIFNGRRYRNQIAPRIAEFVRKHDRVRDDFSHDLHPLQRNDDPAAQRVKANDGEGRTIATTVNSRGAGQYCDLAANAFAFAPTDTVALAPANDAQPDRLAQKVKASGRIAIGGSPSRDTPQTGAVGFALQSAVLRYWGLLANQLVVNLTGSRPGISPNRPKGKHGK